MPHREPIAVIDIGSNSVRLVVYSGAPRAPSIIFNEKVLAGLGQEIGRAHSELQSLTNLVCRIMDRKSTRLNSSH